MIEFIFILVCALVFWKLVAYGFSLGAKATAASERTAAILEAVLLPEKRALVREIELRKEEERAAADLAYRRRRAVVLWIAIVGGFLLIAYGAKAAPEECGRLLHYDETQIRSALASWRARCSDLGSSGWSIWLGASARLQPACLVLVALKTLPGMTMCPCRAGG